MKRKIAFGLYPKEVKTLRGRIGSIQVEEITSTDDSVALHKLYEALKNARSADEDSE